MPLGFRVLVGRLAVSGGLLDPVSAADPVTIGVKVGIEGGGV